MRRRPFALLLVVMTICCALPAQAQQLGLSTEVDYLFVDQGFRDPDQHNTTSGFFPQLNLSLTGPVRPGARLYLDLTGGFTQNDYDINKQSTSNALLVLRGEAPHYRLSLRYGGSRYTDTTDTLELGPSQLAENSKETGVTLILRQPAWPVVNLQYSHFTSDGSVVETPLHTTSTDSRVSALYDLAPLHFRVDSDRQTTSFLTGNPSEANARQASVSLDTQLFPKLGLYGNLQLSRYDVSNGGVLSTGDSNRVAQLRLSTALTPKVALDGEVHSLLTRALGAGAGNDLSDHGSSLNMRSEVLPGLELNISQNVEHSAYAGRDTDSTATYADLLAQLDSRNSLALTVSPSRATLAGYPSTSQHAYYFTWTSQLDPATDLAVSVNRLTTSSLGFQDTRTASKYVTLRYHPDLQTTLGLGLLWDSTNTFGSDGLDTQRDRTIDASVSWLPTSTLTLGLDLNVTHLTGVARARTGMPAFDLRWQPDSRGALTLSWRRQDSVQEQLDALDRLQFTTFSGRFQRQVSRASSLNLTYDVLQYSEGPLAYERRLGVSVTTGLGR